MAALAEQHMSLNLYCSNRESVGLFHLASETLHSFKQESRCANVSKTLTCARFTTQARHGVLTNITWIGTSEYPGDTSDEWVKNWVVWPASTSTWQTAMSCVSSGTLPQGDLRRATMLGKRRQLQDENDKAFGGQRNPSRTWSAHKPLRECGVKMRTVFERDFLEPESETRHHRSPFEGSAEANTKATRASAPRERAFVEVRDRPHRW